MKESVEEKAVRKNKPVGVYVIENINEVYIQFRYNNSIWTELTIKGKNK